LAVEGVSEEGEVADAEPCAQSLSGRRGQTLLERGKSDHSRSWISEIRSPAGEERNHLRYHFL
jgi:hypothetical protein